MNDRNPCESMPTRARLTFQTEESVVAKKTIMESLTEMVMGSPEPVAVAPVKKARTKAKKAKAPQKAAKKSKSKSAKTTKTKKPKKAKKKKR
jgi:hypothetical protein